MTIKSNSKYLESKVLTASPPQLHLMLLEGAVRFGQKAVELWSDEPLCDEVVVLLDKLMSIVEELSLSTSGRDNEISLQLEDQYAFLFRELAACRVNHDLQKLQKCLELITYQRETWKQVCEKLEGEEAKPRVIPTPVTTSFTVAPPTQSSFSLDA